MAPPPTTAAVAGRSSMASTSSEVSTHLPSTSNPGRVRGTEPLARITASALSSVVLPSPPSTETFPLPL
jgi:hypothetical protein